MDLVIDTATLTPDAEALVDPPDRAELMPGEPRRLTAAQVAGLGSVGWRRAVRGRDYYQSSDTSSTALASSS